MRSVLLVDSCWRRSHCVFLRISCLVSITRTFYKCVSNLIHFILYFLLILRHIKYFFLYFRFLVLKLCMYMFLCIYFVVVNFVLIIFIHFIATSEKPEDPTYIGCWWLGYIVCSIGIMLTSIPMWFFPKSFVNNQQNGHQRNESLTTKTESGNESPKVETVWTQVKGAHCSSVLERDIQNDYITYVKH